MEDLSLHILDIVENSIRAKAKTVGIRLTQNEKGDVLVLEVTDDGEGMDQEVAKQSVDPFFTTKEGKRIGLGLPLLAQAAEEADGTLEVESAVGTGTKITATFKLSHIDRRPLGNVGETLRCLKATHPDVRISFEYATSDE